MKRAPKRCLVAILSATLALLSGGPVWAQGARLSRIAVGTPPASAVRFQTPTAPVGAAPALTLSALAPSLVAPAALTPAATPTAAAVAVTLAKPAAPAANAYAALRDAPPAASDGEKKEGEEAATEAAKPFEGKPAKDSAPPVAAKPSALKAFLFSSTAKARALAGDVRNMASGDKEIVPLLGGARTPGDTNHTVRQAQFLLVLDAVLCLGIAFIIGPLLNTAALAAKTGLAAQTPLLMTLGAALIGSSLIYALVERAHAYRGEAASYKSARDLRIALHKSLMSQSVDFHAKEGGSGKLAGRLLKDVGALSMKNTTLRLSLLHYSLHLAFGVGMMLYTSPAISLVAFASIPIIAWLAGRYGASMVKLSVETADQKAEMMRQTQESLQQNETVKTFGALDQELARYDRNADEAAALEEKGVRLTAAYTFLSESLADFFTRDLVFILGGVAMVAAWGLSFGDITKLTLFAFSARYAFSGLATLYMFYKRVEGMSQAAREMITQKPDQADAADAAPLPAGPGAIRFENVGFTYPQRAGEPVLRGLSFEALPGQTVAFVGETGSGKSTIANLLLRLWNVDSGRISVDGHDVRAITRQSLLDRVAVVPQETRLFSGTLRENMLYGAEGATPEELRDAVHRAGADFVFDLVRFPDGLDTQVSEGGSRLSGGERQRVAIVRALLRAPSILILDEATSALDNTTERTVQKAFESMKNPSGMKPTTVVVAHRLSTIFRADRINFLEKGVIVESGTHAELLALDGRYARLWRDAGYDQHGTKLEPASPEEKPAESAPGEETTAPAPAAAKIPFLSAAWSTIREFITGDAEARPFLPVRRLLTLTGLLIAETVLALAGSHWLGRFLDVASDEKLTASGAWGLWPLALGAVAALCGGLVVKRWAGIYAGVLRARAVASVRKALIRHLHAKSMNFHVQKGNESGALAGRLSEDVDALIKKNLDTRVPLAGYAISLCVSTALLLHANLLAGAIVLLILPGLGVVSGYFGQKKELLSSLYGKQRAELGEMGQQSLEQIRTVKMFGREAVENAKYRQRATAVSDTGEKTAKIGATSHMLSSALTDFFTKQLIYLLGAWAVAASMGLTPGAIIAMTFYAGFIKASFDGLSKQWLDYKSTRGEASVIRGWLAEGQKKAPTSALAATGAGEISFQAVSFRYSDDGRGSGLDDVSLTIQAGETVAFVGESGSGKSTLLKLVQNLWTPKAGRVLLDGLPVEETDPRALAAAIAKVPQETRLFDETLRYNLVYGTPGATDEELAAAISAASADFVHDRSAFPQGLDTRVGEGGSTLSGGQRQRVAIVRALLKKPRVLLFDEATSALDAKTQREIQETIEHLSGGASGTKPTTLIVAHNLTTVSRADRIVILDNGRIVEVGSHRELLDRRGAYARLWQNQTGAP